MFLKIEFSDWLTKKIISDHQSQEAKVTDYYAPTSKKLEGHIASGTFVRACFRVSVCYVF